MSESIKKKIGIPLAATMVIVLALAVVASSLANTPASAQLQCSPDQNPAGKTPPGQNK
jgi:Spy/CpxP family protein refolding chaperone